MCRCRLPLMPRPLLLGYFLHQCLESIPGVVFVTPVAAHGHMSGCLFIPGYKCVHMFVAGAGSECVTHNLIHRDEAVFTTCRPDRRRRPPKSVSRVLSCLYPCYVFALTLAVLKSPMMSAMRTSHIPRCFIYSAAVMLVKSHSDSPALLPVRNGSYYIHTAFPSFVVELMF